MSARKVRYLFHKRQIRRRTHQTVECLELLRVGQAEIEQHRVV